MSETSPTRPSLWFVVVAVLVAAAVWATVALAAGGGGSGSSGTSPTPSYTDPQSLFTASEGRHGDGDCPHMGDGGGGPSTTPSAPSTAPSAPSTPSPEDGSSNPGL